ncbi:MAG: hypothetical protein RLZZ101_1298, partial [Pseudomonadota bacterium]
VGGVLAYYFLERATQVMPYLLVIASSSFIYIAVSDLIPQMHRRPHWQESLRQIVLIAAAFMVDVQIGIFTALAIIAHEIPQEIGDFIVLLNAGFSRARALLYNGISGLMAVVGGVLAYYFLERATQVMPYLLVIASSSFIYIAVSDLIPQMHRRPHWQESLRQIALIAIGVGIVVLLTDHNH